jgi:limonene-1,2-epoxide hydrolase
MNKVAVGAVTGLGGDTVCPEETVRAELSAWGRLDVDEIMGHASADAVWDNVAIRAFRGYDEIREAVQGISTA